MAISFPYRYRQVLSCILLAMVSLVLSACASVVNSPQTPDPDPFEYTNRKIFYFNDKVDEHLFKPLAHGYRKITPKFFRTGVYNFFANWDDIPTGINNVLQGRPGRGLSDLTRFAVNSTVGILGLFDVASSMNLEKHNNDFGQTLGKWGIDYSPYVVIPFLGPSTVRDGTGRMADWFMSPWPFIHPSETRYALYGLRGLNIRESYLDHEVLVEVAAFDKYIFMRDAYLQQRDAFIRNELMEDSNASSDDDEWGDVEPIDNNHNTSDHTNES